MNLVRLKSITFAPDGTVERVEFDDFSTGADQWIWLQLIVAFNRGNVAAMQSIMQAIGKTA